MAISAFNYLGNKRKLVSFINDNLIPPQWDTMRLIEPFVGSGSIFLNLCVAPKQTIISDIDDMVVNVFSALKSPKYSIVQDTLKTLDKQTSKSVYKDACKQILYLRNSVSKFAIAALYIYIQKNTFGSTCIKKAHANEYTPCYRPSKISGKIINDLDIIHDKLKNCTVTKCDYRVTLSKCKANDFVILDPPYIDTQNNYSTSSVDYDEFITQIERLHENNAYVLLFNNANASLTKHLTSIGFKRKTVPSTTRMNTTEVVFFNW